MRVEPLAADTTIESDYVAVGHVTLDVLEDGSELPGGAALYGALLAARFGLSATIVTAGPPDALADVLRDLDDDVRVVVAESAKLTTLATMGAGLHRAQLVVQRADDVPVVPVRGRVVHLGPVVGEVGSAWCEQPTGLVGLTPQGLVRRWTHEGDIELFEAPGLDEYTADVIVLSEAEEPYLRPFILSAEERPLIVVTREDRPATVLVHGRRTEIAPRPAQVRSDIGAGDVFASALMIRLAEDGGVEDAVSFAHAAAAVRVEGVEGPAGVPRRAEVEARLARRAPDDPA